MSPTDQQVTALLERSKDDRAFIAGSEVRHVCGELLRARAERDRLEVVLEDIIRADTVCAASGHTQASRLAYAVAITKALDILAHLRKSRC